MDAAAVDSQDWDRFVEMLRAREDDRPEWHEALARAMMDLPMEALDLEAPFRGPDGLLYLRVAFPRQPEYMGVSLRDMITVQDGAYHGLALVSESGDPLYVFARGDLLSLHLYGVMELPSPPSEPLSQAPADAMLTAAPSETLLPEPVRQSLRSVYALYGDHEPKVTLVQLPDRPADLAFDIPASMFQDEAQRTWSRNTVIASILPRHLRSRSVYADQELPLFPL